MSPSGGPDCPSGTVTSHLPTIPTPPTATAIHGTSIGKKLTSTDRCSTMHYVRDYRMRRLAEEIHGKCIGPMPVEDFLETFLGPKLRAVEATIGFTGERKEMFRLIGGKASEKEMYEPLMKALEPFCNSMELVDTHDHPDPDSEVLIPEKLKPDFALYLESSGRNRVTQFSCMELWGEVKYDENDDPFRDDGTFEHSSTQSKDTKGQIASYAAAQFAVQFRTHIFSVLVFPKYSRILRWDRSGVVVTRAIPLTDPYLAEFFWRYTRAAEDVRGFDLTVKLLLPDDKDALSAREHFHLKADETLVKFEVPVKDSETRYYIGRKPTFHSNASATGRATRTFIVYDPVSKRELFLKDTWRLDMAGIEPEGDIYQELEAHGVEYIAPFVCAADIPGHRTRTPDLVSESWAPRLKKGLRCHQHYRLVLGVIGRDLTAFSSTYEFVFALRCAMIAHKQAYERAKILHRDISAGNIILTDDGNALLIDWELCNRVENLANVGRLSERMGTWQFMSAKLMLSIPGEPWPTPTLQDDLESFVHVLTWVSLRHTLHFWDPLQLTDRLHSIFDSFYLNLEGNLRGGDTKRDYIRLQSVLEANFAHPILPSLLKRLLRTLAVRYPSIYEDTSKMQESEDEKAQEYVSYLLRQRERDEQNLSSSDWMIDRFNEALSNRESWPTSDKSVANKQCYDPIPDRERKSQVDSLVPY